MQRLGLFLVCLPLLAIAGPNLSILQFLQGNKPRLPYKSVQEKSGQGYFGACEGLIKKWSNWGGGSGLDGQILIKAAGEPALNSWRITIELDRDAEGVTIYDTKQKQISARKFDAKSLSWNGVVAENEEKLVNIQVRWEPGTTQPELKRININGQGYVCLQDGPPKDVGTPKTPMSSEQEEEESQPSQEVAAPSGIISRHPERGIFAKWPKKMIGMYILLTDDDHEGFTEADVWEPRLHPYQQTGANVLFFTFIHPGRMTVPKAFQNLAETRGTDVAGAIPNDTVVLFAIGGYGYSLSVNPWDWLTSKAKAEAMAEKVAEWPEKYGCDGIDLDIEDGAGDAQGAGENIIHFVRKLRSLRPKMIISQPTYGYPAIDAEIDLINASWDSEGNYYNLADSIGLMVYEGTQSLNYVKNYNDGPGQWEGFPMTCRAPNGVIILGAKGSAGASVIGQLVQATLADDYLGIMVWYASVTKKDGSTGLQYAVDWDSSTSESLQKPFIDGMNSLKPHL